MSDPLPPMPATMPVFVFLHPMDDNHIRLRGGEFFEGLSDAGFSVVTNSEHGGVSVPTKRRLMVFSSVDANPKTVDTLLGFAAKPYTCILVDVTGPIWAPEHLLGSEESRSFWSQPENLAQAKRLLLGVDGVTTPHAAYVEPLMEMNPNVFLLPDLIHNGEEDHDCEALVRFGRTLSLAWHTATELKMTRYREQCAS